LWRDEVAIGFAPGRIELIRRGRGWKPVIEHAAIVEFEPAVDGGWSAGVAALSEALADARWQRAQCRIVISNHHVRFALLDAPVELANDEERAAFVDLRFRAIYGDEVDAWQPTFSPFGPGERAVACAIDRELLDALRTCASAARLALGSAQPYLVAAFNRVSDSVRGEHVWFVAVEHGRVAMAAFNHDRWTGVRNEALKGDIGEAVAALLAQDAIALELADAHCRAYVHAPGWSGELVSPGAGWTIERVGGSPMGQGAVDGGALPDPAGFPLTRTAGFPA
jgi:hypothetical protein